MGRAARLNVAGQQAKAASLHQFRVHLEADRFLLGLRRRIAHGTTSEADQRLIAELGPYGRAYVGLDPEPSACPAPSDPIPA